MPTRRALLRGLGGAGVAAAVSGVPAAALAVGGASRDPVFTFASLPDFFNGDVADLSVLPTVGRRRQLRQPVLARRDRPLPRRGRRAPTGRGVRRGRRGRGSLEHRHRRPSALRSRQPWHRPGQPGAVHRPRSPPRAVVHYDFYADLFSARGLTLYPAIGDHELLDDRPGAAQRPLEPERLPQGRPGQPLLPGRPLQERLGRSLHPGERRRDVPPPPGRDGVRVHGVRRVVRRRTDADHRRHVHAARDRASASASSTGSCAG